MAKLTTDTLGKGPIKNSQSQARKPRQAIPACKMYTSYPSMYSKRHCIKGATRAQNAAVAVGVRRAQYKKTSRAGAEPPTTTLQEARQGKRRGA